MARPVTSHTAKAAFIAGNPTGAKAHDSVMVEPDEEFVYRLRSDAEVEGYVLNARNIFNFDPPMLYVDANSELSSNTRGWVEQQTRNHFAYTTTSDGWNQKGDQRREGCRTACEELGLTFTDMAEQIRSYQSRQQIIFAGLELFADHCHFSNAGSRLAAELLLSRVYWSDQQGVSER